MSFASATSLMITPIAYRLQVRLKDEDARKLECQTIEKTKSVVSAILYIVDFSIVIGMFLGYIPASFLNIFVSLSFSFLTNQVREKIETVALNIFNDCNYSA
jgi:hypothetical protein